jgi:hypothetical protein
MHRQLTWLIILFVCWLVGLLFYVSLKNGLRIWRSHHYWWRDARSRCTISMHDLGALSLWEGRDLISIHLLWHRTSISRYHTKDRPIQSPPITYKGMWRINSTCNSDPQGWHDWVIPLNCSFPKSNGTKKKNDITDGFLHSKICYMILSWASASLQNDWMLGGGSIIICTHIQPAFSDFYQTNIYILVLKVTLNTSSKSENVCKIMVLWYIKHTKLVIYLRFFGVRECANKRALYFFFVSVFRLFSFLRFSNTL